MKPIKPGGVTDQISEMTINGSGVCDTSRALDQHQHHDRILKKLSPPSISPTSFEQVIEKMELELDEQSTVKPISVSHGMFDYYILVLSTFLNHYRLLIRSV